MYKKSYLLTTASVLGLCCFSSAFAAGFQTLEQSATNLGRANADGALAADDLSAIYYNPAAMTLLSPGLKFQVGASVVSASSNYKDEGSARAIVSKRTGRPLRPLGSSGDKSTNPGELGVPPFAYVVGDITPDLKWGVGVTVPFGLSTKYNDNWVGRYHAIESTIKSIDINPSIAYRVSDTFSIGAGISFQYAEANLSKAVFTGRSDGLATITADNWATGFNLGAVFSPSEDTRFGLSYRSSVKHSLKGERNLTKLGPRSGKIGGSAEITLPDQIALSAFHRVSPKVDLMASVRWTGWSKFDELNIKFDDGKNDLTRENWKDTIFVALGADYHASENLTYRAGVAYDQSPIRNSKFRTPRIPGNDRFWLSAGLSYEFDKHWGVDLGYTHVFIKPAKVDNRNPIRDLGAAVAVDQLSGRYENSGANLFSAQVRYKF